MVTRSFLPSLAPKFGDHPEMLITLRWGSLDGCTRYPARTRWHDHRSIRVALGDCTINVVSVVSPIAGERSDWTCRSIEQRPDLRAVIDIVRAPLRRDDLASASVQTKMQFAPGASCSRAVPLNQPLAGAPQLQPPAVHQQM